MNKKVIIFISGIMVSLCMYAQHNPVIFADVPDMSMIRVGDTYYMSSTTMHLSSGTTCMETAGMKNGGYVDFDYLRISDKVDNF